MDTVDFSTVAAWRMRSQQLARPRLPGIKETVRHLVGVQAQDYGWAKWSIGLRLCDATDATIEPAIASGEIVRTWLMRGTLHFASAQDVGWLAALLAPKIIAANKRRYRQLELDEKTFSTSNDVLRKILVGRRRRTRSEIAGALEAAGVSAEGQRAPYLLQRAALDGVICLGPPRGREPTYVLLVEWVPAQPGLPRDDALARLAQRYFASHGPATVQDFAWWSGLPAADARAALDSAGPSLAPVLAGDHELWAESDYEPAASAPPAHLLPPFDEYLLGYRDRTAVMDPANAKKVNAGGGMPRPTILVEGRVEGVWKRSIRKGTIEVTTDLFCPLDSRKMEALHQAARRLGAFYGMPVKV